MSKNLLTKMKNTSKYSSAQKKTMPQLDRNSKDRDNHVEIFIFPTKNEKNNELILRIFSLVTVLYNSHPLSDPNNTNWPYVIPSHSSASSPIRKQREKNCFEKKKPIESFTVWTMYLNGLSKFVNDVRI